MEDRSGDGVDLCRRIVLFRVSRELSAQAKVEFSQLIVPGFAGPNGCKYLPDGIKVLFQGPLIDGYPAGCQKADSHALGKDLGERYGISDALEVGSDFQPFAEIVPLEPGGGIFLEDGG